MMVNNKGDNNTDNRNSGISRTRGSLPGAATMTTRRTGKKTTMRLKTRWTGMQKKTRRPTPGTKTPRRATR